MARELGMLCELGPTADVNGESTKPRNVLVLHDGL